MDPESVFAAMKISWMGKAVCLNCWRCVKRGRVDATEEVRTYDEVAVAMLKSAALASRKPPSACSLALRKRVSQNLGGSPVVPRLTRRGREQSARAKEAEEICMSIQELLSLAPGQQC